jgi:CheY-like chemotaxis protein
MAVKVMVVEDNDDVRAMVVELLRMDPGITLFEAVNIMMPQMDGLEATKRIKRAWPDTKVIVVTAFTQDASRPREACELPSAAGGTCWSADLQTGRPHGSNWCPRELARHSTEGDEPP